MGSVTQVVSAVGFDRSCVTQRDINDLLASASVDLTIRRAQTLSQEHYVME